MSREYVQRRLAQLGLVTPVATSDERLHDVPVPPRTLRAHVDYPRIYVLHVSEHIKIGYATDIATRLSGLQIGNPFVIELVYVTMRTHAAPRIEREAHALLANHRARGEWFKCEAERAIKIINGLLDESQLRSASNASR